MTMATKKVLLCALSAFAVGACADDPNTVTAPLADLITPVGATGEATTPVFTEGGELIDPNADSDGDGISDGDEVRGVTITVDTNGFGVIATSTTGFAEQLEERFVTSDPRFADTDGDGLDDGRERNVKSDPRRVDTDGDTLSDLDEVDHWFTSPTSVDTDGDARGGDPERPRPALFALFDAGELQLRDNPDGGMPLPGVDATSPNLPDSDGDGMNDYDEILSPWRKPTIAELPQVDITLSPGTRVDLFLNVKREGSELDSTTYGTTLDVNGDLALSTSFGASASVEAWGRAMIYNDVVAVAGCCLTIVSYKQRTGLLLEGQVTASATTSFGFGVEGTLNTANTWSEVERQEQSQALTVEGGTIRLSVDVVNTGPVTASMDELVVPVAYADPAEVSLQPLTELVADVEQFQLAPGERRSVQLASTDVPADAMRKLMARPTSLMMLPARFDLTDVDGLDFDFTEAAVREHTGQIQLDFGDQRRNVFVAANIARIPGTDRVGTTIGAALTHAGIDFEALPNPANPDLLFVRIEDRETVFHTTEPPALNDPGTYEFAGEPKGRLLKQGWFAMVTRSNQEDADDDQFYANLFEAPMYPGDIVTLIYSQDLDQDGLSAFEEARRGTRDDTPDTDGDGLSDYFELREGWVVDYKDKVPQRVFPPGFAADLDGDGVSDFDEAPSASWPGSHPILADTDGDGFSDLFEKTAVGYDFDPANPADDVPLPEATCDVSLADGCYVIAVTEGDRWCQPGVDPFNESLCTVKYPGEAPGGVEDTGVYVANAAIMMVLPCSRFTEINTSDSGGFWMRGATVSKEEYAEFAAYADHGSFQPNDTLRGRPIPQATLDVMPSTLKFWVRHTAIPGMVGNAWDSEAPPQIPLDSVPACHVLANNSPTSSTTDFSGPSNENDGPSWYTYDCADWSAATCDETARTETPHLDVAARIWPWSTKITATDPQGDLVSGLAELVDVGKAPFTFAPAGDWQATVPFGRACGMKLTVQDAAGFEVATTCTLTGKTGEELGIEPEPETP